LYIKILAVIPGDLDYAIPQKIIPRQKTLIPYPINTDILVHNPLAIEDKIIIFMGLTKLL
jgi:hypothetical protein